MPVRHDIAGLGRPREVNLGIPDQGPEWKLEMEFTDLDLVAILLAYRLQYRRGAQPNVGPTVKDENEEPKLFLSRMADLARIVAITMTDNRKGYGTFLWKRSYPDLNIFPIPEELDADMLWKLRDTPGSSCLFTRDSGLESALA